MSTFVALQNIPTIIRIRENCALTFASEQFKVGHQIYKKKESLFYDYVLKDAKWIACQSEIQFSLEKD